MKLGFAIAMFALLPFPSFAQERIALTHGWQMQSSAVVQVEGSELSRPSFHAEGWYPTSVPSTVLAALVANKVYPDPFFGTNLRAIPGTTYPIGKNFSNLPMPDQSPFATGWWFRTTINVPAAGRGKRFVLHFDGINYRADIWFNGRKIGDKDDVAGTYRVFDFDVTDQVLHGGANALAVEVYPPQPDDLAWTWVDWNPAPPDKNMGLFRSVYLVASGDVALAYPHVVSHLSASRRRADLTVYAEVRNLTDRPVRASVTGEIGDEVPFSKSVRLAPRETKTVSFSPTQFTQLRLPRPRLWWPAELGDQPLYELRLRVDIGPRTSDRRTTNFGIREITSELTSSAEPVRLFRVNGRPLLIRGGGWAPDMLLRADPQRQEAEIRYVRDMRLNTIRMEGKLEDDHFFELADRYGVLVLAGWCCCDIWEQWDKWKPETKTIAAASQRDQIRRLRSHPSLLAWMNGSDNPPTAEVERTYIGILEELNWPNPYVSSATAKDTTESENTGVKMTGPYDWVPPSYWLQDDSHGGAHGFNTETSPGPAVPPVESLRKMLPADHLWPIDDVWNYHAGGGQFRNIDVFTAALAARYGTPSDIDDYARKAQMMTYEGERAMFEAFARNKYKSTGVIQWMLNNAWPSMIWHLYDYYLQPAGGYFGTKKACEPVHVQYSYDDRSVVVVNNTDSQFAGEATVRVLNVDGSEKFVQKVDVKAGADAVVRLLTLPGDIADLSTTYFVDLNLVHRAGHVVSRNFYWLSTSPDVLDWDKSTWYFTPVKSYADLTGVASLPPAAVTTSITTARQGNDEHATVSLKNTGNSIAFFLRLQIMKGVGGDEVLPVMWEDNFVTLLPGETRHLTATFAAKDLAGSRPHLVVTGSNLR